MAMEIEQLIAALGAQQAQQPATAVEPKTGSSGPALASLAGQLASAISPSTWGGRIGQVAAGSAQAQLMAQQQAQQRQALLQQLGLTPEGAAGPTTATINADGTITTKGNLVDASTGQPQQNVPQAQPQPVTQPPVPALQAGGPPVQTSPFVQALPLFEMLQR